MIRGRNVHIPTLAVGDVPVLGRGRSLGISAIQVKVLKILKNHMYKDGSVCQRAAHISTLQRVSDEQWLPEWASLAAARENSKKPVRSAVKLYY